MKIGKTLCAVLMASLPTFGCGNLSEVYPQQANSAPVCDYVRGESLPMEPDPEWEKLKKYAAKFVSNPSEELFDQEGHFWGRVIPIQEEVIFTDKTKFMENLTEGRYSWEVDNVLQQEGVLLPLVTPEERPIPDLHYEFNNSWWHSVDLKVDQVHVSPREEGFYLEGNSSRKLAYFSAVPQTEKEGELNWHPVPISDKNYAFRAPFRDGGFGKSENDPFKDTPLEGPLTTVKVGETKEIDFSSSFDMEDFGKGYDCNGIQEYSVCVSKKGEACQNPLVNSSGKFDFIPEEKGDYTLELKVKDYDNFSSSKILSFKVE